MSVIWTPGWDHVTWYYIINHVCCFTELEIYYYYYYYIICMTSSSFMSYIKYDKWHMTKAPYVNMWVKSSAKKASVQFLLLFYEYSLSLILTIYVDICIDLSCNILASRVSAFLSYRHNKINCLKCFNCFNVIL